MAKEKGKNMAKKLRASDRRKIILEAKKEEYKKQEQLRKEQEEQRKKQEELKKERKKLEQNRKELGKEGEKKKPQAKALGLKSTFILDKEEEKVLLTSFGKGNKAIRDKYIIGENIADIDSIEENKRAALTVEICEKGFNVSRKENDYNGLGKVRVNNPVLSKNKGNDDLIHCRKNLEQLYFGEEFKDNIHIQLIYNILDIEKILSVQINNIVFSLNNLLRWDIDEDFDLIGSFGVKNTYEEFCDKSQRNKDYRKFFTLIKQPQMRYFGTTFSPLNEKGKKITCEDKKEWEQFERKCYNLLAVLGMMRQATAHGDSENRSEIYKLGEKFDKKNSEGCRPEARKELDALYQKRIHEMNQGFLKNSKKDILMLFRIFNAESKETKIQVAQDYYEFIMLKSYKNTGFSIRHLRETMIDTMEEHKKEKIKDDNYNQIRGKLYRIIDFVIYHHYQKHQKEAMELISKLRGARDEIEKELVYHLEAKKLGKKLKQIIFDCILLEFDKILASKEEKNYQKVSETSVKPDDDPLDPEIAEGITFIKESAHSFSEMIYLLTVFLDGKEINILLTQLIHCFENISSFMDVMEEENLPTKLKEEYEIFENSKEIANELRIINSFAKMTEPVPKSEKIMFIEAAQILGYSGNEETLEKYVDALLGKTRETDNKKKKGFARYIWNNVIRSTRFRYLVRYSNPKKIREFVSNLEVVKFVLRDIPDDQIIAYYNSCLEQKSNSVGYMRDKLAEKINNLKFEELEEEFQKHKKNDERDKNIIRLYLTVLYLVQKNLIYVNSRYFLAFHCVERDEKIYKLGEAKETKNNKKEKDWKKFAEEFIDQYPPKERVKRYLKNNFECSDKKALKTFRNSVLHLNVIRNADEYISSIKYVHSYFALYHYLLQSYIADKIKDPSTEKLKLYLKQVETYHTYCKDFVKALNVPFAYNLPRYKNLSIDELFDRNNYRPNKTRKWIPEKKENGEYVVENCDNKSTGQTEDA